MRPMTTQHDPRDGTGPSGRATLLLTAELAEPAQGLFEGLRQRHFPPERNLIPAHVSVFHTLPGDARARIAARLRALAAERCAVEVTEPFTLGRGVAFRLRSPALLAARAALARDWAGWLTAQDAQGYRPHVTVQNKVTADTARETLWRLRQGFAPFSTEVVAWRLWRYLGGPWEALERVALPEVADPVSGGIRTGEASC